MSAENKKIPPEMRCWGQEVWGKDSKYLSIFNVPTPKPQVRDLLIQVKGVACNPVDLKRRAGEDGKAIGQVKWVGWDGSGIVVGTGEEVKNFKIGDEVYFAGDIRRNGCFAEYVAIDERAVALKPKSLDWAISAAIPLTALTVYEGFDEALRIKDGKGLSLLILGGAGGVGSLASQVAKHLLHFETVISTASRKETGDFCKEHGADFVINHHKDLGTQLAELGFKEGVDVVFNCSEADGNWDSIPPILKTSGRVLLITGMHRDINMTSLMFKRCSVHWEFMFARLMFDDKPEIQGNILNKFAKLVDDKVISPRVRKDHIFKISEMKKASDLQASGKAIGKIVLDCSDWPSNL